jgi:hypothetical protein
LVGGSAKVGVAITIASTSSSRGIPSTAVGRTIDIVPAQGTVDAFVAGTRRGISQGEIPVIATTKITTAFGKNIACGSNLVASAIENSVTVGIIYREDVVSIIGKTLRHIVGL